MSMICDAKLTSMHHEMPTFPANRVWIFLIARTLRNIF
jgi:hypothetical protein